MCIVLLCTSFLFFHLSGAFFPLAIGCLIAAIISIGSIWWPLPIRLFRDEATEQSCSFDTSPMILTRTVPVAEDDTLHEFPLFSPSLDGYIPLLNDPDATVIAGKSLLRRDDGPRLLTSSHSEAGILRAQSPNEDTILVLRGDTPASAIPQPCGLFVVADGMGGHANGREASRIAIETIRSVMEPVLYHQIEDEVDYSEYLKNGVAQANSVVNQRNVDLQPQVSVTIRQLMGSTLTAALVIEGCAYIANVGDSRTYLYRKSDGGLKQLTTDHSVVATMVQAGIISPDEIYTHPKRNQIYRCLGEKPFVDVEMLALPLLEQDILLLCSDGLWEMVRDKDIQRIIEYSPYDVGRIANTLLQTALRNGGADNVSVIVVMLAGCHHGNQQEERVEFAQFNGPKNVSVMTSSGAA
jgi:serine/threonine protein phosphatase PrpC